MILSGLEIIKQIKEGGIEIAPFSKENINPNSYDLRLADKLLIYTGTKYSVDLDSKYENITEEIIIPEEGFILQPGVLYLGQTVEYTKTHKFVPMLEGRSSIGRLGIFVHITAGFGDIGFCGHWTLEISCIHPIRIYPNMKICQIYYHTILGEYEKYNGKYQNNQGVQASRLYKDVK